MPKRSRRPRRGKPPQRGPPQHGPDVDVRSLPEYRKIQRSVTYIDDFLDEQSPQVSETVDAVLNSVQYLRGILLPIQMGHVTMHPIWTTFLYEVRKIVQKYEGKDEDFKRKLLVMQNLNRPVMANMAALVESYKKCLTQICPDCGKQKRVTWGPDVKPEARLFP